MNSRTKNLIALFLPIQIVLIFWIRNYPEIVEQYYSNGIYAFLSSISRILSGWIPFSIGDILYGVAIFLLIRYLILHRHNIKNKPKSFLRDVVTTLSLVYFFFHLLWGLNYYREPLQKTLMIEETHTKQELHNFVQELIVTTNKIHLSITKDSAQLVQIPYSKEEVFNKTKEAYTNIAVQYPFLTYNYPSIKKSNFSLMLTYMGYGGYLNPFTNEAQVNGKLPLFRFPVVCAHEIGHQIGYSAENETNLIGYLVAANSEDIYFKYAAYSYALSYCLSNIREQDKEKFNALYAQLNVGVKKNYKEVFDFWEAHENPMEPVFKSIFNSFLKANHQKEGIKSYNSVVSLLVNYHKKHPL